MANILIVDDRPVSRQYLAYILNYASHSVLEASDGVEALGMTKNFHPDLIIADILMAGMDGIGLVREIRADPAIARTPVIFYTAMYRDRKGPAIPADIQVAAVLPKPSEPNEILRTVHQALGIPLKSLSDGSGEPAAGEVSAVPEAAFSGLKIATLIEVGLDLSQETDPPRLVDKVCRAAQQIIGAELAAAAINDEKGLWPGYVAVNGAPPGRSAPSDLPGREFLKELQFFQHPRRLNGPAAAQYFPFARNLLGVRIASAKRTLGAMYLCNKEGNGSFDQDDERLAETLAAQLALAYENVLLTSELRSTAEELARAKQRWEDAYHQSEEGYQDLVKKFGTTAEAVIIVQDPDGQEARIVLASPQWSRITGYSLAEISRMALPDFFSLKDRSLIARTARSWLSGAFAPEIHEVTVAGPQREVPIMITGMPFVFRGKRAAILYVVDITERKALESLREQFISLVSHELKTPLTVVLGGLSTVLNSGDKIPEAERLSLMQDAYLEAQSLADTVNNLLEISRSQANRLTLTTASVDSGKALEDMVAKAQAQYPDHKFVIDIPHGLRPVRADVTRLEHIIFNLLDNAAKYSPAGTTVRAFASGDGKQLEVGIADQGPGMSASEMAKIFTPFERLGRDESGSTGGTGLGLVVCKKLVEAHGGRIWAESQPGKGSTFKFTIPIKD
ncbi:MAG: response regulator [Chloroflexi bacterium]|nr:response regulator [Chloroflexota bacterium]